MKKIIILFAIVVSMISCSKDDDTNLSNKMSATIDNAEWNTITRVTVLNDEKFIITGTSLDGKSLSITTLGTQTGIYELSISSIKCAAIYKESVSTSTEDAYAAITGEVELTEVNTGSKEISGTFSFVLTRNLTQEPVNITKGVFNNLKYTESQE
jgi:hypothetical protein